MFHAAMAELSARVANRTLSKDRGWLDWLDLNPGPVRVLPPGASAIGRDVEDANSIFWDNASVLTFICMCFQCQPFSV